MERGRERENREKREREREERERREEGALTFRSESLKQQRFWAHLGHTCSPKRLTS
jgi:hypothetical protein